jgi:hypothetical protein
LCEDKRKSLFQGGSVKASNPQHVPEAGNAASAESVFGVKPSTLYHWQKRKLVKSVLAPGRGNRGVRIYDFASIRNLLGLEESAPKS